MFATRDLQEADSHFYAAYGSRTRIQGIPSGNPIRHRRTGTAQFAFDRVELPATLTYNPDPLPSLVIVEVRAGTMERQTENRDDRIGAGDVMVLAEPGQSWTATTRDADLHCTVIDPGLLAEVASSATNRAEAVRFTGFEPLPPSDARLWKDSCHYLEELLGSAGAGAQPLVQGTAARLLAATALATFDNTANTEAMTDTSAADGCTTNTLDRAITFIQGNAEDDINATDISDAAYVSLRALQLTFRRHLNTTPMAYLRSVRMERAHRELTESAPGAITVTAIASRWGFTHPGRFAAAYRAIYGSAPSTTLHG